MCKIDCVFFMFYTVQPSASSKGAVLTGSVVNDYNGLVPPRIRMADHKSVGKNQWSLRVVIP
jgi:hypothetical protein